MRMRGRLLLILAGVVLFAACGPAEKTVIDKYFGAVNRGDNQTLGSFATVGFDKQVDAWKIAGVGEAVEDDGPLPKLYQAVKDIEQKIAANKKEYRDYYYDHQAQVDQVIGINKKKGIIPSRLSSIAKDWDKYVQLERQLKDQLKQATDVMEAERRNVNASLGEIADIETRESKRITKVVDLDLTIEGGVKPYAMTLSQYVLVDPEKQTTDAFKAEAYSVPTLDERAKGASEDKVFGPTVVFASSKKGAVAAVKKQLGAGDDSRVRVLAQPIISRWIISALEPKS
jgi:hypothetical protein